MILRYLFICFIFCTITKGISQESIVFLQNKYDEALERAEEENKPVFFYIHSNYCYECEPLDSVLKTDPLKQFFNLNFINSKIDYNEPIGQRIKSIFSIKALPSLILLNNKQVFQFLIDENFSSDFIIQHAEWTINPKKHSIEYLEAQNLKKKMLNYERMDSLFEFTVIDNFVFEQETEITMYNQSLLHKTLNDGLASEHAEKYLATQQDWTTDKNMNFIMDFVDDARSEAFQFIVQYKPLFYGKFGQKKVDDLITKLVNKRLYQLQPPPNYEEAKTLMRMVSPEKVDQRTYEYLIDLRLQTNKVVEYLFLERKYVKKFGPKDHERMIRMSKIFLEEIPENYNTDYYISAATTATKLEPNNIDYLFTLARLYIKKGDKCGALENAVKAFSLASQKAEITEYLLELILEIDKMHGS